MESDKLEKKKVRRNLFGARNLENLGTMGRLGFGGSSVVHVSQLHFLVDY